MISKYNKTEVYQECTSVFFDFVQDVLRLSTVCPIVILRNRKSFHFKTYNHTNMAPKNHYIFLNKASTNNSRNVHKKQVRNQQGISWL